MYIVNETSFCSDKMSGFIGEVVTLWCYVYMSLYDALTSWDK